MHRLFLVSVFFLLALGQARAEDYVFYQPAIADQSINQQDWARLWQKAADEGVKTLIVQWTAYGDDIDFNGKDGWLAKSLRRASEHGLDLVVGLYMDPAYYRRLSEIDAAAYDAYFQWVLSKSLRQAKIIRVDWNLQIKGWYLPLELDDWNYRGDSERTVVSGLIRDLSKRLDAPLHLSSFAAGYLASDVYGRWLESLNKTGLHVWAQDGAGTGALPDLVRQSYLDALPCGVGIVHEVFRQTSKQDEAFQAVPSDKAEKNAVLAKGQCHPASVFSLRYLEWARPFFKNGPDVTAPNLQ